VAQQTDLALACRKICVTYSSSYSATARSVWPWLPFYMVSEQSNFNRMELSAPFLTPSYPTGPMFSVGVVSLS
jgi:hypothetical protein